MFTILRAHSNQVKFQPLTLHGVLLNSIVWKLARKFNVGKVVALTGKYPFKGSIDKRITVWPDLATTFCYFGKILKSLLKFLGFW